MKKLFFLCLFITSIFHTQAQDYFPKNNSLKTENNNYIAFTNATIYVSPTEVIKKGTLLIQNGKVSAVGKSVSIPENSIILESEGMYIYPSFIDIYSNFGVALPDKATGKSPQYETKRDGYYWNDHVMPEKQAYDSFKYQDKKAKELREAGFGVVNSHIMDGIARGTGILVALNDESKNSERIINTSSGTYFSFKKSKGSKQSYPTSLMGAIALLEQIEQDANWYKKGNTANLDLSLEAYIKNKDKVSFIEAGNKENDIRADKISDKFNLNHIIVGGGDEYESIDRIKATEAQYIIPINFPDAYDVTNPYANKYISLKDMREWNQAPTNPKVLDDNNITFALTTYNLKKPSAFKKKLDKAIDYGLDKTAALEALTTIPAKMIGESDKIGSLKEGSYANFLITSGDIFDEETTLYENWVQGAQNVLNSKGQKDIRGKYSFSLDGKEYDVNITGKVSKPNSEIHQGESKFTSKLSIKDQWITLIFNEKDSQKVYRYSANVKKNQSDIKGKLIYPNGNDKLLNMTFLEEYKPKEEKNKKEKSKIAEVVSMTYPNVGYGYLEKPKQEKILFKNATVWTNEDEGVLIKTDVLINNGKIEQVGKDLKAGGATVVDATGKHLTSGIVDEHSHIALSSTNEAGQNSSAEVNMANAINAEDINLYRNIAGGVTTIQLLHGSANPIGGQSAIIKPRWGENAEELLYKDAPKFIKFALGENVKQSNWQSFKRFPQTRMGVEQVYVNYFTRALEYDNLKKSGKEYRYDKEMEVLAEILNGERFITCHSYVQSEINMLMKVADRFDFTVATFTHILEGYKVADKMKEHGVGASTFSDWWAYKYEVNDAIPYNASIMNEVGVTVAINSDDREMSRRLNQEAAKSVKYGGMTEEDAWKMVTLNPAKLLHLDHEIGSLKVGKSADVVLWSDHPLSVYAKAEKTIIDGIVYFDIEKDLQQREKIKTERNKLIQMMLNEKENGGKTRTPVKKENINFTCETLN